MEVHAEKTGLEEGGRCEEGWWRVLIKMTPIRTFTILVASGLKNLAGFVLLIIYLASVCYSNGYTGDTSIGPVI